MVTVYITICMTSCLLLINIPTTQRFYRTVYANSLDEWMPKSYVDIMRRHSGTFLLFLVVLTVSISTGGSGSGTGKGGTLAIAS